MKRLPLKLFFSYAREDQGVRDELDTHLDVLEREGLVSIWWDGRLTAGTRWSEAIERHLRASDVVVFLISPAFFQSQFIAEHELPVALEMERTSQGAKRVVCVVVQRTQEFESSPLGRLQRVPPGDLPLDEWEDRVHAMDQVVVEIRRTVMQLVIDAGGSFEFRAHAFTEAELARLDPAARQQTAAGLRRLRALLVETVPERKLDRNLLVASWCLGRLGNSRQLPESLYYLAQVISAFDVVSLQKVSGDLAGLRRLIDILGPEWGYLITDVTLGAMGADERFAILYYRPRVTFANVSGGIVLPADALIAGEQFARTPLLASFQSGSVRFRVCSAHIRYGADPRLRTAECETLAAFLTRIAARGKEEILLTGDFNLLRDDSPVLEIFRARGVEIPPETIHPSLWVSRKPCDLIGHLRGDPDRPRALTVTRSGLVEVFDAVLRDGDFEPRPADPGGRGWRKSQISDHLPVWVEFSVEPDPAAPGLPRKPEA